MTYGPEIEAFVRATVVLTGEPCIVASRRFKRMLLAVFLADHFAEDVEAYVLFAATIIPETDERFARATRVALHAVEKWVPEPPEGVEYVYEEGTMDMIVRVEADALGLSLLQLALNEAGAGIVIRALLR